MAVAGERLFSPLLDQKLLDILFQLARRNVRFMLRFDEPVLQEVVDARNAVFNALYDRPA